MASTLRKKSALRGKSSYMSEPAKEEELLVFGYQSNIFRDDEKALFIDQGKHLIPWNGDDSITIDRYDVRAYLSDLSEYDADIIRSRQEPMTEKERNLEALLDEERYLELRVDIAEKMMYEEEEMKRLNEALSGNSFAYAAVGFNYEQPSDGAQQDDGDGQDASLPYDQPYTSIPGLHLPPNIIAPATMKMHAIIEKTASFVGKQGIQMEIILKTKQKNNQQFEFLNYEHELNPYYRHLVNSIKLGKYVPAPPPAQPEPEEHDESHSYLHPSLMSSSEVKEPVPAPITSQEFLESIQSKLPAGQIANTPYALLLSNLKKHAAVIEPKPLPETAKANPPVTAHRASQPPPPPPPTTSQPSSANVSPVDHREGSPVGDIKAKRETKSKPKHEPTVSTAEKNRLPSHPVHGPLIVPPPPDQQPIIDKMADYVARNGPEFEMVVKMKKDERFRFLESDHCHYNYYQYKKNIFLKELEEQKKEKENEKVPDVEAKPLPDDSVEKESSDVLKKGKEKTDQKNNEKLTNSNRAVSFCIKAKEEETTSLKTRAALLDDSSDEDEDDEQGSSKGSHSESDTATSFSTKPPSRNVSRASLAALGSDKQVINQEDVEKKQAEQKLADKLAAAAREKLARESRERQLQAHRKRKAAMFINMLKDANVGSTTPPTTSMTDNVPPDSLAGSTDSPFNSSVPSRSMTPTLFLEQSTTDAVSEVALASNAVSAASAIKIASLGPTSSRSSVTRKRSKSRSRDRSRSPKRHRKRSKTPPTAYTFARSRPSSKSPSRHKSRSELSKTKSKHSRARSRSPSHSKSTLKQKVDHKGRSRSRSHDRKSKKESGSHKSSHKSSHKTKSSKDRDSSRHHKSHKSKKHKSKSKRKRNASSCSSNSEDLSPSKKLGASRMNPVVVDLTGSPRTDGDDIRNTQSGASQVSAGSSPMDILPHIQMLTMAHEAWMAKKTVKGKGLGDDD